MKLILAALAVAALAVPALASAAPHQSAGTLQVAGSFRTQYKFDDAYCPPGTEALSGCVRFVGTAEVPGLGRATSTYVKILPPNDPDCPVVQFNAASIEIAGKGTLHVARQGRSCGQTAPASVGPLNYTVIGGSGMYAGASGRLAFRSAVGRMDVTCACGKSTDTLDGHADRLGRRVRRHGAHAHGRGQQDGEGEEGREERTRDLPDQGAGRQGRHAACYMRAEVRKSVPYRQDARHVCRDRQQRERWERKLHRHRQAGGLVQPVRLDLALHTSETGVFDAQRQASKTPVGQVLGQVRVSVADAS